MKEACFTAIGVIIGLILIPILVYLGGWCGGYIVKIFFGTPFVNGMNALFNTIRFQADMIPNICGVIAVIGSYFRSTFRNNSK